MQWHLYGAILGACVEKRVPTYDLEGFRQEFCSAQALRMTRTAQNSALALGLTLQDVVQMVQGMKSIHFYKSMTTHTDHRIWQDVYHVPWRGLVLYVKLMVDELGRLIISLKEK